jgi:fumarate reductase subunit D
LLASYPDDHKAHLGSLRSVGVFLGTFIHQILTEQVLVVLLVVLLSITAHRTLGKAMRMYRAEVSVIHDDSLSFLKVYHTHLPFL